MDVPACFEVLQHSKMIHQGVGVSPFTDHKFMQNKQEVLPLTQKGFERDSASLVHLYLFILDKALPAFAFQLLVLEPLFSRILQTYCCCYKFPPDFKF